MTDPNDYINQATADVIEGIIARERTTKAKVAKGAGFSVATMTRLVSGEAEIPISRLYDIARALGITAQEILDAADARALKLSGVRGQNPVIPMRNRSVDDLESSGDARAAMSRDAESDEPEEQAP